MIGKTKPVDVEEADVIALGALRFLAEVPERMGRFMALTGIGPDTLRNSAGAPEVLAAVLDHLMQDDSTLLMFCAENAIDPETIGSAHACLVAATGEPRGGPTDP